MKSSYKWTRFWSPSGVSTDNYDFLPDPTGYFGDKRLVTFDQIKNIPCLILLGNPGIGKSETIRQLVSEYQSKDDLCLLLDFREFDDFKKFIDELETQPEFSNWRENQDSGVLNLFLDSLDEGRLEMKRIEHDLVRYLRQLPLKRLHLRVTCRTTELPVDFADLMRDLWSGSNRQKLVQTFQLTQLREQDVNQTLEEDPDIKEPKSFISAVRNSQIEPFAAYPVTLVDMLIPIYKQNSGRLPSNRLDIYKQGCHLLIREVSTSRRDDKHAGNFSVDKRFNAACQIALLSIIANRPRILRDYSFDQSLLSLQDFQFISQQEDETEELLYETLRTSLFTSVGEYRIWAHRSYGEYLCAEAISQSEMKLYQIQSLLINPSDAQQRISPKLYEVVSWLASMRRDVFDWIFQTQPLILLNNTSIDLTDEQRVDVIKWLIERYKENVIIEDKLHWSQFKRLCHDKLGNQLTPYLENKALSERTRHLCLDFVISCDVSNIDDVLVSLALDPSEIISIRQEALSALQRNDKNDATIAPLRDMVLNPSVYKVDMDLRARAIDIIWPYHLNAAELFSFLRLQNYREQVIGSPYDQLFRPNIVEHLKKEDLSIALDWVAHQTRGREHDISLSGRNFMMQIMQKAWQNLDDDIVLSHFANAAWARLIHFHPVIKASESVLEEMSDKNIYAEELVLDSNKRHRLLDAILNVLRPDQLDDENQLTRLVFAFSRRNDIPFLVEEDTLWLLEQTKNKEKTRWHKAYSYFLRRLAKSDDSQLMDLIYQEYKHSNNPSLKKYFTEIFDPVVQTSSPDEESSLPLEQPEQKKEAEETDTRKDYIQELLIACWENSLNWWQLSLALIADEDGYHSDGTWDIRNGFGWQTVYSDEQIIPEIYSAAVAYIKNQNPFVGNTEPSVAIHERRAALEGYRALFLLNQSGLDQKSLDKDDWRRWAVAVVFNIFDKDKATTLVDDLLLEQAFEHASDSLLEHLETVLADKDNVSYIQDVLGRFEYAPKHKLDTLLLSYLSRLSSEDEVFYLVLSFLMRREPTTSHKAQSIAVLNLRHNSEDGRPGRLNTQIIWNLAYQAKNVDWWESVWNIIKHDQSSASEVFEIIADWHRSPYLQYLSEEQLYQLYDMAAKLYPYSEDINFRGGGVPTRYMRQEWRNGILREIAGRGTQVALEILEKIYQASPQTPNIINLLEQAKLNFRIESWIPAAPATILELLNNKDKKLVRSPQQLLELVIETLNDIQLLYNGSAAKKNTLWNQQADDTFRPCTEDEFSDALSEWLRDQLKRTVINREPQVRFVSDVPDRTDIQIEAFDETGMSMTVIIEVKGCWYKGSIVERMQTQLVDQYLTNNPRCSHGIYLLGNFDAAKWDSTDNRLKICKNRRSKGLEAQLVERQKTLKSTKPIDVRLFIFDALRP